VLAFSIFNQCFNIHFLWLNWFQCQIVVFVEKNVIMILDY